MQELIEQQDREPLNFGQVWQRASFHNKIEMQRSSTQRVWFGVLSGKGVL
jgi:hypothetical protein